MVMLMRVKCSKVHVLIVNLDNELYLVDFSMNTYCTDMKTDNFCKVPYIVKLTREDYDALFTNQIIELENYELLKFIINFGNKTRR